jgi:hypothetical protein
MTAFVTHDLPAALEPGSVFFGDVHRSETYAGNPLDAHVSFI